jgi:hypothetical protein
MNGHARLLPAVLEPGAHSVRLIVSRRDVELLSLNPCSLFNVETRLTVVDGLTE